MATADYWSGADLAAVNVDGLINEDVMQKIWDISRFPLPVQDMVAEDGITNAEFSWTLDELATPDATNARVDGSDSTANDASGGTRVKNYAQISTKDVQVSTRANASDTIGRANELAYQLMMRQRELRRDVDCILLQPQASRADDGDSTAGLTGGLPSWLETNTDRGTGGADGGFNTTTGIADAPTAGDARALSEATVRDISESIYNEGGEATHLMSTPAVIRKFSEYMFTSSARIATLQSDQAGERAAQTAKGSVNVFVSDFSVLEFVPNRLQKVYDSGDTTPVDVANVFILDPMLLRISKLINYRTLELGRAGLAEKRLMEVQYGLKVLNEKGLGVIADINPASAATA